MSWSQIVKAVNSDSETPLNELMEAVKKEIVADVNKDITALKTDVTSIKSTLSTVNSNVNTIKTETGKKLKYYRKTIAIYSDGRNSVVVNGRGILLGLSISSPTRGHIFNLTLTIDGTATKMDSISVDANNTAFMTPNLGFYSGSIGGLNIPFSSISLEGTVTTTSYYGSSATVAYALYV